MVEQFTALKSKARQLGNTLILGFLFSFNCLAELQAWRWRDLGVRNIVRKRMLGKRMNRTASMSQLGSADFDIESEQIPDSPVFPMGPGIRRSYRCTNKPIEPAHFLDVFHICNRRLSDGRDIYMYR